MWLEARRESQIFLELECWGCDCSDVGAETGSSRRASSVLPGWHSLQLQCGVMEKSFHLLLVFRNEVNIWILVLHLAAWFNVLSLLCFLDCNSKDVRHADGNTGCIENEKCKDEYGRVFGSLPKLIKM